MNSGRSDKSESAKNEDENELDFSNTDIRDIILNSGLEIKTYNELIEKKKQRKEEFEENNEKLNESEVRKWMAKHGKKHLINFDDKERSNLKRYFKSLDDDGSGSIGVDELVEPLISLGIADSIEEVKKIIDSVDDDGSGKIEFTEFLKIIGSADAGNGGSAGIVQFFKNLIHGKVDGEAVSSELPFHLIISTIRRKKMMDSLLGSDHKQKQEGEKILNSYARYLSIKKQRDLNESGVTIQSPEKKALQKKGSRLSEKSLSGKSDTGLKKK